VLFKSQHLIFRHVGMSDASLLLKFRTSEKAQSLNPVVASLEGQEQYLEKYWERFNLGDEIYCVIEDKTDCTPTGLVRLHSLRNDGEFNWGSFIMSEKARPALAIDAIISIYSYGFDVLGKDRCGPFPVKKDVPRVKGLHQMLGMSCIVEEQAGDVMFLTKRSLFDLRAPKFQRMGLGQLDYGDKVVAKTHSS
jgi:hypothetical protein